MGFNIYPKILPEADVHRLLDTSINQSFPRKGTCEPGAVVKSSFGRNISPAKIFQQDFLKLTPFRTRRVRCVMKNRHSCYSRSLDRRHSFPRAFNDKFDHRLEPAYLCVAHVASIRSFLIRMSRIRLLSTDFDGTLLHVHEQPRVLPELEHAITSLRSKGCIWAINTGRSLELTLEGLREGGFRIQPDFILANEREIFIRQGSRWEAATEWNRRCMQALDQMLLSAEKELRAITTLIDSQGGARLVYENGAAAGIIASSDQVMDDLCAEIDALASASATLRYQRNSIYLRFSHVDYHKGASLTELAATTGVPREAVLAIGDQFNDLPMLDSAVAGMIACPSNAIIEVKKAVRCSGGFIANLAFGAGVLEAIQHFS